MSTGPAYRELSIYELDQGFYGWRSETASTTTQRPEYWGPVGLTKFALYPRSGDPFLGLNLLVYNDNTPLSSDASYIDIDEASLSKVLDLAHALLSFKQGVPEGTESIEPLKQLLLHAAQTRNAEVTKFALYKNYMGRDDSKGEPETPEGQRGVRS